MSKKDDGPGVIYLICTPSDTDERRYKVGRSKDIRSIGKKSTAKKSSKQTKSDEEPGFCKRLKEHSTGGKAALIEFVIRTHNHKKMESDILDELKRPESGIKWVDASEYFTGDKNKIISIIIKHVGKTDALTSVEFNKLHTYNADYICSRLDDYLVSSEFRVLATELKTTPKEVADVVSNIDAIINDKKLDATLFDETDYYLNTPGTGYSICTGGFIKHMNQTGQQIMLGTSLYDKVLKFRVSLLRDIITNINKVSDQDMERINSARIGVNDYITDRITEYTNAVLTIKSAGNIIADICMTDTKQNITISGRKCKRFKVTNDVIFDFTETMTGKLIDVLMYVAYTPTRRWCNLATGKTITYLNCINQPLGHINITANYPIFDGNITLQNDPNFAWDTTSSNTPNRHLIAEAYYYIKIDNYVSIIPECKCPPDWMIKG